MVGVEVDGDPPAIRRWNSAYVNPSMGVSGGADDLRASTRLLTAAVFMAIAPSALWPSTKASSTSRWVRTCTAWNGMHVGPGVRGMERNEHKVK